MWILIIYWNNHSKVKLTLYRKDFIKVPICFRKFLERREKIQFSEFYLIYTFQQKIKTNKELGNPFDNQY